MLGSIITLLWVAVLTGVLVRARPVEIPEPQELELVMPPQPEVSPPTVIPPVKPMQPPPKSVAPKSSEPPRPQPMVALTTNNSSPIPQQAVDPQPVVAESIPMPAVESAVAPTPLKIEPLFRLTRHPDFGDATTLKYPVAEQNRGREGSVIAEFVVDPQGAVRDIKILKSAGALFDQAVIDDLGEFTFSPPYIGERPVAARFRREFKFKLD